jgi:protein phosphatase
LSAVLPISVGAASETGLREQNQDCMTGISSPFGAVYVVADGMGGHRGGAEASRRVVESFERHLLSIPGTTPARDALSLAIRLANVDVLEVSRSGNAEFAGMGSTVVLALVRQAAAGLQGGLELIVAHVGDSRAYLYREGVLRQLTKDHTQVQWLIDSQALDEVAARSHPGASVLTRAMGQSTDLQADISEPLMLQGEDRILLCSDGLSGFATGEQIAHAMAQFGDPTECAAGLVRLALASGSDDNITVQILRIGTAAANAPVAIAANGRAGQPRKPDEKTWLRGRRLPMWAVAALACVVVVTGLLAVLLLAGRWSRAAEAEAQQISQRITGDAEKIRTIDSGVHKDLEELDRDISGVARKPKLVAVRMDADDVKKKLETLDGDAHQLNARLSDNLGAVRQAVTVRVWRREAALATTASQVQGNEDRLVSLQARLKELEGRKEQLERALHGQPGEDGQDSHAVQKKQGHQGGQAQGANAKKDGGAGASTKGKTPAEKQDATCPADKAPGGRSQDSKQKDCKTKSPLKGSEP